MEVFIRSCCRWSIHLMPLPSQNPIIPCLITIENGFKLSAGLPRLPWKMRPLNGHLFGSSSYSSLVSSRHCLPTTFVIPVQQLLHVCACLAELIDFRCRYFLLVFLDTV